MVRDSLKLKRYFILTYSALSVQFRINIAIRLLFDVIVLSRETESLYSVMHFLEQASDTAQISCSPFLGEEMEFK